MSWWKPEVKTELFGNLELAERVNNAGWEIVADLLFVTIVEHPINTIDRIRTWLQKDPQQEALVSDL